MVIAVPAPVMRNAADDDKWIPQFLQDVITGDLARFSAMTVLDRANDSLAIAEQQLSETGFYSDDDFLELGSMTNARYLVAGNIRIARRSGNTGAGDGESGARRCRRA
jgi:TolB-like protein